MSAPQGGKAKPLKGHAQAPKSTASRPAQSRSKKAAASSGAARSNGNSAGKAPAAARSRSKKASSSGASTAHVVKKIVLYEESGPDQGRKWERAWVGSLAQFIRENDFDTAEVRELRALKVGQTYIGGGGAAPFWKIKRTA